MVNFSGGAAAGPEVALDAKRIGEGIDPFYLYLDLVAHFGCGRVFLLDAAKDNAAPQYQKSVLGVAPLLEVMVKDHDVRVTADGELLAFVAEAVGASPHWAPVAETCLDDTESVLAGPGLRYRAADPMAFLEQLRCSIRGLFDGPERVPFSSGLLGYIGYDAVHYLEHLPRTTTDDRQLPDIRLQWHAVVVHLTGQRIETFACLHSVQGLPETVRYHRTTVEAVQSIIDGRLVDASALPCLLREAVDRGPAETLEPRFVEDVGQATYEDNVRKAIAYIQAGDIFQVVLSKRVRIAKRLHHYVAYDRLRRLNPSPYMFMAEYLDMRVFGTSPEVQFRVVHGLAEMRPIAGTSKGRGRTQAEDDELVRRLLGDDKEQAEHVMLVDLCRNDLGRVCKLNTVRVPEYLVAERYSHVVHLVSSVVGGLRDDVSVFHALLATFPAGTLSGAPKIRAMEIIDELEHLQRGPYGGMVGMVDFDANANTAIIIRSVVEAGDEYFIQAGAGIVADSQPTQEWMECGRKSGALLDVLLT